MDRFKYNLVYKFSNENLTVFEIKQIIHSINSPDLYYWLVYDKKNGSLNPLRFISSEKKEEKEYRMFEEASLVFGKTSAIYKEGNDEFKLKADSKELHPEIKELIQDYLLSLTFR